MPFHSLHATSHALQPMQIELSVKNPLRGGASVQPVVGRGISVRTTIRCITDWVSGGVTRVVPVSTVSPARRRYSST